MTTYFDVWKKKMVNNGGSITQSKLNSSKNFYNNNFTEDPSYKLAILRKRVDNTDSDLDTRIVNVDTDVYKKKIYVRPDTNIEAGDYIIYPNKTYLALSVEDNLISPYANCTFCNYTLKWMYKNVLYVIHCIVSNQTKYTLGVSSQVVGITEGSSRYQILMSYNDFSKSIDEGQRFIFNGNAWRTTQVDWISEKGLMSILLGQDNINYEIDDTINEIAGAYENQHTYTYDIPASFEVANGNEYNLVYSIKDETGQDFDYSLITVLTNDNTLIQVTNTNGVISITGLSLGIGSIKLSVPIGATSEEFNINFEVKDIVTDTISYTTDFSQSTTNLQVYVTNVLTVEKYLNGIKDDSLQIAYSFDTNTQTLISQGKIVITVKSPSSIGIKNASITVPTDIYLTVSDVADNTLILDSKKITLTGM